MLFLVVLPAASTDAVPYPSRPIANKWGIKGGFLTGPTFHAGGERYDSRAGLSGGIFFDATAGRSWLVGFAIDLHDMRLKLFEERRKFFEISLTLKRRFRFPDVRMEFRPGLAAGFGYMAHLDVIENSSFATGKVTTELVFHTRHRVSWVVEVSVLAAPWGRNINGRIRFSPTLLVRGGLFF